MSRNDSPRGKRAVLAALALLLCLSSPKVYAQEDLLSGDEITPQEVNYKTETVQLGTFTREVSTQGYEYYPLSYDLKYEHADAKFVEFKVNRGDEVKAGDVLAEFRIESSEAALTEMELTLTRTEEETERGIKELKEKISEARKAVSQASGINWELRSLEQKRLEVELERYRCRQEFSLEQQRAKLEKVRADLEENVLTAPCDGVITGLAYKNTDDAVSPDEVLVSMYSQEVALLWVDNSTCNFRYNMPVTVTVGNKVDRVDLSGRIVAADDLLDDVDTGRAVIQLDPHDPSIQIRYPSVSGQIISLDNVLIAPRNAVTMENGKYYVNKLTDGMVQKRYIAFGQNNPTEIWVVQGVSEGETLIID